MSDKVRIAILDSGINKQHRRFRSVAFAESRDFTQDQKEGLQSGHGTNVFDRLRLTLSKLDTLDDYEIYDFKVYRTIDNIEERSIIDAIRYCIDIRVDIVNISIGIVSLLTPPREIYDVCFEAATKGILIVAAGDNFGDRCYPADFKFVCGVAAGIIDRPEKYGYDPEKEHFIGKGDFQRLADLDGKTVFRAGTSYAAGHISALFAIRLKNLPHRSPTHPADVVRDFRKEAVPGIRIINSEIGTNSLTRATIVSPTETDIILRKYFPEDKFGWLGKVAVYPFSNKEFAGTQHFPDQVFFDLAEVLDFPRSLIKNKDIDVGGRKFRVKISPGDMDNPVDTFVIGYPEDIASSVNVRYYDQIRQYIYDNDKNAVCFDPRIYKEISDGMGKSGARGRVYCPLVTVEDARNLSSLVSMGKVTKPVLAVAGISSKNGKFSTQLRLRQILGGEGYRTGWISTEQQGELFGADFAFPYGFSSSVTAPPLLTWNSMLRGVVRAVEETACPDIIITGHQAGITGRENNMLANSAFLNGVRPDGFVCSVSPQDDFSLIERVLNILRYYYNSPVLFFNLNEMELSSFKDEEGRLIIENRTIERSEWEKRASQLTERFNIPVYNSFRESHGPSILGTIVDFFS